MADSAHEMQPAQVVQTAEAVDSTDEDVVPMEKANVNIDPNAARQTNKFSKRDVVHMSIVNQGNRTKGVFTVSKSRLHSSGQYIEYQLADGDGRPFRNGAWIRERDLRLEQRGKR